MLEEHVARWEEEYRERFIAEGMAKGREECRTECMNEGLEKGLRKILLFRFGEISDDASNLIAKAKDPDILAQFILYAHYAESQQKFVELIKADLNLS